MFGREKGKKHSYHVQEIRDRFQRNEHAGKDIYARIAGLKNVDREGLVDEVFILFREAKHQSQSIRQTIKDRTQYEFDFGDMNEGDRATYLAEETANALRDHITNTQTFFQVLSEQLPDVHYSIQKEDAVSMVAAMIREQRLEGILEGLRLAGLLNEPRKRNRNRHEGGFQPD